MEGGYFKASHEAWELVREAALASVRGLRDGVPEVVAATDLSWWEDAWRMSGRTLRLPSLRELGAAWGWGWRRVQGLLTRPERWADTDGDRGQSALDMVAAMQGRGFTGRAKAPRGGGTDAGRERDESGTSGNGQTSSFEQERDEGGTRAGRTRDEGLEYQASNAPILGPTEIHSTPTSPLGFDPAIAGSESGISPIQGAFQATETAPEVEGAQVRLAFQGPVEGQAEAVKRDVPREVWSELQAVRKRHEPGVRGQELTTARRSNLRSRISELLRAGLTREDLFVAAEWVYTSTNIRAEGARKTGDPIETLLRPKHTVVYVELALRERDQGRVGAVPALPQGLTWQQILADRGEAYLYDSDGNYTAQATVAMATGVYPDTLPLVH